MYVFQGFCLDDCESSIVVSLLLAGILPRPDLDRVVVEVVVVVVEVVVFVDVVGVVVVVVVVDMVVVANVVVVVVNSR